MTNSSTKWDNRAASHRGAACLKALSLAAGLVLAWAGLCGI